MSPISPGTLTIRIHYRRLDDNYTSWVLHARRWLPSGPATSATTVTAPSGGTGHSLPTTVRPTDDPTFGVVFTLQAPLGATGLVFTLERPHGSGAPTGDPDGTEQEFGFDSDGMQTSTDAGIAYEGWYVSGDSEPRTPGSGLRIRWLRLGHLVQGAIDSSIAASTAQIATDSAQIATSSAGIAGSSAQAADAQDLLVTYPMLTSPADTGGPAPGGGGTSADAAVVAALRATLGRLPQHTDAKAFVASLNASFERHEEQGHTVVTWRPRAALGQTELGGGVTGEQASLHYRASRALAETLPVLARLRPLRRDPDSERMAAARSTVEALLNALVEELGTPGGPRRPRVRDLLAGLVNHNGIKTPEVKDVAGAIGAVRDQYGLKPQNVFTVEEEQNYSDYVLVRDYVLSVSTAWDAFDKGTSIELGTALLNLSAALRVVVEGVDQVESAMDSVFLDDAERTVLKFPNDPTRQGETMAVAALLSWVSGFAGSDAPRLLQEAGRDAKVVVSGTAERLTDYIGALVAYGKTSSAPKALKHPRVITSLLELHEYTNEVREQAEKL